MYFSLSLLSHKHFLLNISKSFLRFPLFACLQITDSEWSKETMSFFFYHDVAFTPLENHALVKFIFKNNINC